MKCWHPRCSQQTGVINKQTNKQKTGKPTGGWKWTETGSIGSSEHEARWSIDQPLTNTIEILDVMWEANIHNLSASQMWVKWGVDRREHWVLISGRREKVHSAKGGLQREERRRAKGWRRCKPEMAEQGVGVWGWRWNGWVYSTGKPLRMVVLPDTSSDRVWKREMHKGWREGRQ